jgi:hypothetical protein
MAISMFAQSALAVVEKKAHYYPPDNFPLWRRACVVRTLAPL